MHWKINKRQVDETGITNKGGPTLLVLEEPKVDEHDYRTEISQEVNVLQCHFSSILLHKNLCLPNNYNKYHYHVRLLSS